MVNAIVIISLFFLSGLFFNDEPESKVLTSERQIVVKSQDEIIVKEKSRILIARKGDVHFGFNRLRETDFIELNDMNAVIYDLNGNVLKELEDEDMKESSVSYNSIYNEHNTISHQLSYPNVPYIIENELEYEIKSAFFLPNWDPQWFIDVGDAKMEIVLEEPLKFKYKDIGGIAYPEIITDNDNYTHYKWEVKNIPKFKSEFNEAPEARFQFGVRLEPVNFDLDGYNGDSESWSDFGTWYYKMIKDNLSFSKGNEFGSQFLSISNPKDRIKKIYKYLQENTRYVLIALGIDGWRPHKVDDIHNAKYGDCKDLSVYMLAMLKQAGIDAYPGLVLTRDEGIVEKDFPGNSFNHCIAVVPMPDDTLFLECTSDVTSVDDFESDIEGVNVLLIKPKDSRLIKTPLSTANMNETVYIANAIIYPDRSLKIMGKITLTGNSAIDFRGMFRNMVEKEKREWLVRKLSRRTGDVKINLLTIDSLNNTESNLYINFDATIKYFASKAGSRFIFEPELFNRIYFKGEEPEERKMPLLNSSTYADNERIHYSFPKGYSVKNQSSADTINSEYGQYLNNIRTIGKNNIIWTSKFKLDKRYISLEEYPGYYEFMEHSKQKSQTKLVLVKN